MSAETIAGILKRINGNQFAVRRSQQSYRPGQIEIMVSNSLTRHYRLVEGASVTGRLERIKGRLTLTGIETLGGLKPEEFTKRPGFKDLIAVDPHERFDLGACLAALPAIEAFQFHGWQQYHDARGRGRRTTSSRARGPAACRRCLACLCAD